ncbi:MAG: hypothetical protein R3Y50_08190 [Rikenellaceae bacterium]
MATLLVIPLGNIGIERVEVVGFRGDYIVHCLVYTPWMYLGMLIMSNKFNSLKWFIIGVIFVAVMELIQCIIPYRGYNIYDLIAGEIGIIISLITFSIYTRFIKGNF